MTHRFAPVLLAALACASPLAVPEPPAKGPPAVAALAPAAAFARQRLVLTGKGFDPVPERNEVKFGAARALAALATEERLEVLVPEDAGPGPVVVTTPEGTSAPVAFTYLGLGHPRRGVETGRATLSFETAWMGKAGGRTYAYSPSFNALVDLETERVVTLPKACDECPADDDVVTVPLVLPGAEGLLLTLGHGEAVRYAPGASPPLELRAAHGRAAVRYHPSPAPGSTRLWRAVRPDPASAAGRLELVDARSFAVVAGPVDADAVVEVVPIDDRWSLLADPAGSDTLRWGLLDVEAGTRTALPALDGRYVVAVAPVSGRAYFFGGEGHVVEELSAGSPVASPRPCPVQSPFVSQALAFEEEGSTTLVAALVSQGLVVAFDPASGRVRWSSTAASRPQALAYDAAGGLVLVQDEEAQVVFGLTAAGGQPVWRTPLAPVAGLFAPAEELFERGRGPRGLVQATVGGEATAFVSMPGVGGRSVSIAVGTMSVGAPGSLPRADAFYEDGAGGALAYDALVARLATPGLTPSYAAPARPEALARGADGTLAVARGGRVVDVWGPGASGAPSATWEEGPSEAQAGEFFHLRPRRSGGWTAVRRLTGGTTRMQLLAWAPGLLERGEAPGGERTLPGCDGALPLPGSYELLCDDGRRNVLDDLSDGPVAPLPSGDQGLSELVATSPDGRMLATRQLSTIKLYRFAPGEPLVLASVVELPWLPTGLSFSATGEVLLVASANAVLRIE